MPEWGWLVMLVAALAGGLGLWLLVDALEQWRLERRRWRRWQR